MSDLERVRNDVVDYVGRQLVGPFGGDAEVIADPPNRRYLMGILFPRSISSGDFFDVEGEPSEDEEDAGEVGEESLFADSSVQASNDFLPSSVGISFFGDTNVVTVTVSAARYETIGGTAANAARSVEPSTDDQFSSEPDSRDVSGPPVNGHSTRRKWRRVPLPAVAHDFSGSGVVSIWDNRAEIHVRWRQLPKGALITVTLLNCQRAESDRLVAQMWGEMLLQTGLQVALPDGCRLFEYPAANLASKDPEEAELRLQYRDRRTYAVGHGCSAEWDLDEPVTSVRTEVMPRVSVPTVASAGPIDLDVLTIRRLTHEGLNDAELIAGLSEFVDRYTAWAFKQSSRAAVLKDPFLSPAKEVMSRVDQAVSRMRDGVEVLRADAQAMTAFRLANQAMLMQMTHAAEELAGTRRSRSSGVRWPATYDSDATWYPFQLGFALTALRGLVDPDHEDREIVDLVWFPTGGGKTEAYLLLAVFDIFHRRLIHKDHAAGTAVISRYTLSLLTAQQFQRAATTTCAAELVRRKWESELGRTPISIGLWVGESTTPNKFARARELFDELREAEEPEDRFLLERCPWCGTEILPRGHSHADEDYGITATDSSFRFNCPRKDCPFHERLWVHVVDDDLYAHPPTFLLGTVDKFAGLAWEPRSGLFFGANGSLPPSLIIQDELHLLTGPLGTISGLYESAIHLLCQVEGRPPKVVSSTATIRRAGDQIRGLFGREVHLFPPSGLDADNSFFAAVDPTKPCRMYVGLMAQGHTSDTATVQACTAMLQAPVDLDLAGLDRDAYWTLVAYHNSLRELGRTVTMALDDIPARIKTLMAGRPLRGYNIEELTSNVKRSKQLRLLDRLSLPDHHKDHVGLLATTNMLSVGVHVPRLGFMLMNGQPKATAEYIQATSRVGRSTTPGLIFTLFRSTRPRDRSHYEGFRPFHSSLYRHVEPTSVTPFARPARDRALHAALVILVRHSLGLVADDQAGEVLTREDDVRRLIVKLADVVRRVEPREAGPAKKELESFFEDWKASARESDRQGRKLYYKSSGKGHSHLLKDFNAKGEGRQTLRSMRNVDRQSLIAISKAPLLKEKK